MDADQLPELTTARDLLEAADMADDARQTALWCLRQLPEQYRELARTYDGRHLDEIVRLARVASQKVAGSPVADAVRVQLVRVHQRLGFGVLELKTAKAPARRPRKAG
jgi:hypothetical protein